MKKKTGNTAAWNQMFDYANPKEWKQMLWLWYSTTVTGSYLKETSKNERNDIKMAFEFLTRIMDELDEEKKE